MFQPVRKECEQQSDLPTLFRLRWHFTAIPKGIPNKRWSSVATDLVGALNSHASETLALAGRGWGYQKGPEAIFPRRGAITHFVAELYD